MPSIRISKESNEGMYYLTFTVKNWYYVLDRYGRWDILANSLEWFKKNKKIKLYAFVFMINHLHLLIKSKDSIGFARDFKRFTAKNILKNIRQFEPAMLKIFQNKEGNFEFWSKTNMPETIETERFFLQKINYIHNNPVKRNYVLNIEEWYWTSANKFCRLKADDI
jgi:REP element-mobilizing transposase RayT